MAALIEVVVMKGGELAAISSRQDGSIAERLKRIEVRCVVATLGAGGCVARVDGRFLSQDAFAVTPVDTTAAGDTFCGALVAALDRGLELPEGLRFASAAAALACNHLGAQSSIPNHAEVQAFLASHAVTSP